MPIGPPISCGSPPLTPEPGLSSRHAFAAREGDAGTSRAHVAAPSALRDDEPSHDPFLHVPSFTAYTSTRFPLGSWTPDFARGIERRSDSIRELVSAEVKAGKWGERLIRLGRALGGRLEAGARTTERQHAPQLHMPRRGRARVHRARRERRGARAGTHDPARVRRTGRLPQRIDAA
jgi:hypothetical protein